MILKYGICHLSNVPCRLEPADTSEMVSQFVDEMLNTPLYADPFSSATENMLDKNDWKLALTPSYIQEGAVRSDPPSPLKRLLAETPPKDEGQ